MHPAPSVIVFTAFSGLGLGLLAWLGVGLPSPTGWAAFWLFGLGYALAVGGLLSSTFHLGHPERALKAFTQWRSSWLSREAWASCAALLAMAPHAAGSVFLATPLPPLGWLGAALCLATVATTSMIYAQLRTVPRWHAWTTPATFLALSVAGGALLAGQRLPAVVLLAAGGALQLWTWSAGDGRLARSGTTLATATGLTGGAIRPFEPPHTGPNYLTREMVFVVGRRRSRQLRGLALGLGFALPVVLLLLPLGTPGLVLAALAHVAGILAQRWLFFAEAEHVVGLYYGRRPPGAALPD